MAGADSGRADRTSESESESDILYVPVFTRSPGIVAIRTARLLPSGEQAGLAFTSPARLAAAFGPQQAWILVPLRLLHTLLAPRGITQVQVDPRTWRPARPRQVRIDRIRVAAVRPRLNSAHLSAGAASDARDMP